MSIYIGAKTVVRTVYGNSKSFEVKVGMHQGSGLSPLLFVIVMEAISREFRVALSWELLYADDLAVIAETEEQLTKRLNEWKDNVESKGMRVNMKVMISAKRQMVRQKEDGHAGSAIKVLVAIHYSVLDARNGYIRNVDV